MRRLRAAGPRPSLVCVALALAAPSLLPHPAPAAPLEVLEEPEAVTLRNAHLAMTFSRGRNGALISLVDRRSGREFLAQAAEGLSLYRLSVSGPDGRSADLSSADAQGTEFRVKRAPDRVVLTVAAPAHRGWPLRVSVSVTMEADSPMTSWHAECAGDGSAAAHAFSCPVLPATRQLGDSPADDRLLWPALDGLLFTDLTRNDVRGADILSYPGAACVQFAALYDGTAGLYLAARDPDAQPKRFTYQIRRRQVDFAITHLSPETGQPPVRRAPECVVGVFHGDWHDAADRYKSWAIRQPWCARRITQRDDIPRWLLAAPPMLDYGYAHPDRRDDLLGVSEMPRRIASYAGFLGRGAVARPQGWEKHGAWVGPDCFPPHGGDEFIAAARRMRAEGNRLFLYLEGYQWMLDDPRHRYDGNAFFERHCGPDAVTGRDGQVWKGVHSGRTYAEGCAATRSAREMLLRNAARCVDAGADAIQIEVVGGGGKPCYSTAHGHPPGFGPWFHAAFASLLDTLRSEGRRRNPDLVVTIEEPSEPHIQRLDGYNGRDYQQMDWPRGIPGAVGIPLFTYLYHEYAVGFSGWHYVSGKSPLQMRDMAANFLCGKIDGISIPTLRDRGDARDVDPHALGFFKETTDARATYARPYLILGEMRRPTRLDAPDITFDHAVRAGDRWAKRTWTEPLVTHSVWKAPSGTLGYALANVSDTPAGFDIELRAYDLAGPTFDARWIDARGRRPLLKKAPLPHTIRAGIGPRQVALIEVSPAE